MTAIASTSTIILLSTCSFVGNVGAALTGFGQAIIFLFVWQIVELAGYDGDFKYAVFIQALSLFSMQPLLLHKSQVVKYAFRRILLLFVPITLISTPLGQLVSGFITTRIIQAVAGVLVTLVALWELYCKRNWLCSSCRKGSGDHMKESNDNDNVKVKSDVDTHHVFQQAPKTGKNSQLEENQPNTNLSNVSEPGKALKLICINGDVDLRADIASDQLDHVEKVGKDEHFEENQGEGEQSKANNKRETPSHIDHVPEGELKLIGCNKATWYTLLAGGASGFLGGMVAIRGPPLIFYFLHPPHPVTFNKNSQRATGVVIMFCNVLMRQVFYLVNTFNESSQIAYKKDNWRLYLSVIVFSIAGGYLGDKLFYYLKDSQDTIRGILAIFLFFCGISLMISAFS